MPSFYIEQFGCRATHADGAALERQLLQRGCVSSDEPAFADIVIVNTCTVTASADAQARDAIRKLYAANPGVRIIVTGCYAQRAPEELSRLPGVAWVVGNSHKPQIPELIEGIPPRAGFLHSDGIVPVSAIFPAALPESAPPAQVLVGDIFEQQRLLTAPVLGGEWNHTRPTLKIQDGCNSRCSFCVIPFVRGKSHSLPPDRVIRELQRLSEAGFREIVLSGINLGTYGRDLSPRVEFEDLLRRILEETTVERLRVSSIEPMDVTRDLVELLASTQRFAQHFHMPLQSGCDRVLAAMHRWYRAEHYARRVELVRECLPHAAIGADVIAGFPSESEEEHATTMAFIKALPFSYLHVFSYSMRPGTKAASLPNQVPGAIIKRRARELRVLAELKAKAFRESQVGKELRVLTLRQDENLPPATTPTLSSNYLKVRVDGVWPTNQWLDTRISGQQGNHLVGKTLQPEPHYDSKITCASA